MRTGDFLGAVKCFKKAMEFSPKNVERLCNLSKAMDELGDEKGAEGALEEAKKVDASSDLVVALETTNALEEGDIETAKDLMRHAGNLGNLVAELNNTGVAYTRAGEPDEGIRFYEKTLEAIPPENAEWRLKVTYNLALAYARQEKIEAAHDLLGRAQLDDSVSVSGKMRSLKQRLKRSIDTGAQFVIQASARPEGDLAPLENSVGESPWEKAVAGFENVDNYIPKGKIRAGEYGCVNLFIPPQEIIEKCESYLVELPVFRLAQNLEKKDLSEVS
jgi:Flp pilus assembly protein TadD